MLSYDDTINEIQDVLESLIAQGQHAWAPYISNWSIKTLGTLSKKYKRSDGRGIAFLIFPLIQLILNIIYYSIILLSLGSIDIASICNYWLGSSAMRCLLALTMSCFSKLSKSDEDIFTDYLLNTYSQSSASFDWVIARLGSCFPHKIISKYANITCKSYLLLNANRFDWNFSILNCGLSTFVKNNGSNVDSEIGILSYLSFIQHVQLKTVLKDMIEVCQQSII